MAYNNEEEFRKSIERLQQEVRMRDQLLFGNSLSQSKRTYTESDLNNAVECENYELAAIIRDELNKL